MSRVAVSADRRFHRARVKPTRKRRRVTAIAISLAKYGLPLAALLFVAYQGIAAIGQAAVFQIAAINVTGNQRMSADAVRGVLKGLVGTNIMAADLEHWRGQLQATPWIREATFKRSLPSTLDVVVAEREPIAIGRLNNRLYLIDERGVAIDEYGPEYSDFDLPIVDGLQSSAADAGGRPELVARLVTALRAKPSVAERLSQIDVSDAHNAAVIVTGDPAKIFVGEDRFLQRLESYLGLAAALRERVPDIDYVDLRFDDRIYVRPSGTARGKKLVAVPAGAGVTAQRTSSTGR